LIERGDPETAPVIAAVPPSLQERCIVAPGLLAQIIVSKFCDHPRFYRQEAIFWNRHAAPLPRQSMARWMGVGRKPAAPLTLADQLLSESSAPVDPPAAPVDLPAGPVDFRRAPGGRRMRRKTCKPQWLPR
jgi:transposase